MKKFFCILLSVCMALTTLATVFAADVKTLTVNDLTDKIGDVVVNGDIMEVAGNFKRSTIGFANVDLTGVKSITINAAEVASGSNGEIFRVKVDDPNALSIGDVVFVKGQTSSRANIEEQTGVHTLYFATTMYQAGAKWKIKDIVLHSDAKELRIPVSEASIIDNWSDTWAATDDFGRKVADYEEVGPVKEGNRAVGMFYWFKDATTTGVVSKVLEEFPDAWNNHDHPGWKNEGQNKVFYWAQPAIGFYSQNDYWVMRQHAIQLGNAGVDAVFYDWTNDFHGFSDVYLYTMQAFADAMADGIKAPKVSAYGSMSKETGAQDETVPVVYYNQVATGEWDDTIFYWNGKPFYINYPMKDDSTLRKTEDKDLLDFVHTVETELDLVGGGELRGGNIDPAYRHVNWLEEYPQHPFGIGVSGRPEFMNIGVAINQTYVNSRLVAVFSDPYAKGRGYSEVFGEDYSADGPRKGYFFRESAAHLLEEDPEFIFVDGWNELAIQNMDSYWGYSGTVFIDTLDDENSRDFEPTRDSKVKDDYYNMLVDFIRKYKGVRPAPVASAETTIDINGAAAQWDSVAPEFVNDKQLERDYQGSAVDFYTGEPLHYVSKLYNSIARVKVARDANNFYFYVKAFDNIQEGTPGWMNIYINTDRNYATGWAGFDYAINLNGAGVVSKAVNDTWAWENIGTAAYTVQGDVLQLSVPRELIGETGTVEFEFKVTDNCITDGDYLDFYSEGSVAPMGKFNYLYTEIEQTALTAEQRKALDGTSIIKAGVSKAIIEGGKMPIYERDLRITPFEMNGTLYVPAESLEEILGYGNAKVEYTTDDNTLYVERFDLVKVQHPSYKVENNVWSYAAVGSYDARKDGNPVTLTAPITTANGLVYVPLSYISDIFGWNVENMGNGAWVVSRNAIDKTLVESVLNHIQ